MERQVDVMLKYGIIVPSSSPFTFLVLLVKKMTIHGDSVWTIEILIASL
jgi:hypothetical protein